MPKPHFPFLAILFLACSLLALNACSPQPQGHSDSSKTTTFTGTADNAKAGAVVITEEGQVYYIAGKSSWDDQHVKQLVEISGVVSEEEYIPVAKYGGDGAVSQGTTPDPGTENLQMVLRDATWKLVK